MRHLFGERVGFVLLNCVPLAFYLLLTGSRLLAVIFHHKDVHVSKNSTVMIANSL